MFILMSLFLSLALADYPKKSVPLPKSVVGAILFKGRCVLTEDKRNALCCPFGFEVDPKDNSKCKLLERNAN